MAVLAETDHEFTDDRLAARNAVVLAAAQALGGANTAVIVATGGIAGSLLAPSPLLATLPISVMVVGIWIGTLPVGMLAKAYGRRFALQAGAAAGALSGIVSCAAMLSGSFALLLFGMLGGGLYAAANQSYRFAAADTASAHFRARAVSWVLAGGVFSAIIGPQIVILTKNVWPAYLFAATYLAQSACAVLAVAVLALLRVPRPATVETFADGRPLAEIVRKPRFIVAASCGLASYAMMNLMMTSAPLAMVMCNHSIGDAALGIQWHVIGMYAPSFFTGALIARLGLRAIMAAGLALIVAAAIVALTGVALWNFWISLLLLGVGWNFSFIGATTLVTECCGPHERNKVQAFNDFLIFGSMAIASFSSGALLARYGWTAVNEVVFPVVIAAAVLLAWGTFARRPNPV
jgi:MFS family permease